MSPSNKNCGDGGVIPSGELCQLLGGVPKGMVLWGSASLESVNFPLASLSSTCKTETVNNISEGCGQTKPIHHAQR